METSLLRYLLTRLEDGHGRVLEALRRGEVNLVSPAQDPGLLVDMLAAVGHRSSSQCLADQHGLAVYLEQQGFDPWRRDAKGHDAFDHALRTGNLALVRHLSGHSRAPSDLASRGTVDGQGSPLLGLQDADMLQALLEIGFDRHVVDRSGNTLLHLALQPEVAQVLLKWGLDPSQPNHAGLRVRQYWDASNMRVAERQALDGVLNAHAPMDAVDVVRDFAHHLPRIGMTRSRERLRDAGVDPARAHSNGLSLPELVVAQALRSQLCMDQGAYASVGNPVQHRKWRRALLSTLKLCGHDPAIGQWRSPPSPGLVASLEVFLELDQHLERRSSAPLSTPKMVQGFKPKPKPSVDETRSQIAALVKSSGQASGSIPAMLRRALGVLEKMTDNGCVDNGSLLASHLLCANLCWASVQEDAPLVASLLFRAQCGRWNEAWWGPDSRVPHPHPLEQLSLPVMVACRLMGLSQGPALVFGMLSKNNSTCSLTQHLVAHLRSHPGALSVEDPIVKGNLGRLLAPNNKNAVARALAEDLSLDMGTAQAPKTDRLAHRL